MQRMRCILLIALAGFTFVSGCAFTYPRPTLPPDGPPQPVSFEASRSLRRYHLQVHLHDGSAIECDTPCTMQVPSGPVSIGVFRRDRFRYLMESIEIPREPAVLRIHDGNYGAMATAIVFGILAVGAATAAAAIPNFGSGNLYLLGAAGGFGVITIPFAIAAGREEIEVRYGGVEKVYRRRRDIH